MRLYHRTLRRDERALPRSMAEEHVVGISLVLDNYHMLFNEPSKMGAASSGTEYTNTFTLSSFVRRRDAMMLVLQR